MTDWARIKVAAKLRGLNRKDFLEALADYLEGNITARQLNNKEFLERYYTPSTGVVINELKYMMRHGERRKVALKLLKSKYPRCSPAQWKAVEEYRG